MTDMTDTPQWTTETKTTATITIDGEPVNITITPGQATLDWLADQVGSRRRSLTLDGELIATLHDQIGKASQ